MDIASTLPSQPLLPLVLLLLFLVPGAEAAPNTAGLVVGCVLGTLAFVLLIEGILYCCCFRKRKIKKREAKKRHHQDIGECYHGMFEPVNDIEVLPTHNMLQHSSSPKTTIHMRGIQHEGPNRDRQVYADLKIVLKHS
ncbi:hypothetical protein CAPTEDRAFT_196865 [Capitella teleta]|uniref:Uncharacterized protein n=1 Tax=Capitella teleta TaxID=283909 RepID=R7VH81_CAPTE|nr:hypothetical protein CAPTEDRAFT_196865 [Capitella teleta]|eukprot:ELU17937.1 hypothetical protein CAPTEDRAFT_196865 [Capitella teleta]